MHRSDGSDVSDPIISDDQLERVEYRNLTQVQRSIVQLVAPQALLISKQNIISLNGD